MKPGVLIACAIAAVLLLNRKARAMPVTFKPGVKTDLARVMAAELPNIEQAHADAGIARAAIMTSGTEGVHSNGSKHYTGEATDWRTHDLAAAQVERLVKAMQKRSGPKFEVFFIYWTAGGAKKVVHAPNVTTVLVNEARRTNPDQAKRREHIHDEYDPK